MNTPCNRVSSHNTHSSDWLNHKGNKNYPHGHNVQAIRDQGFHQLNYPLTSSLNDTQYCTRNIINIVFNLSEAGHTNSPPETLSDTSSTVLLLKLRTLSHSRKQRSNTISQRVTHSPRLQALFRATSALLLNLAFFNIRYGKSNQQRDSSAHNNYAFHIPHRRTMSCTELKLT